MDWLTAVTKIIEALAWPIVLIIVAIAFRTEINSILERVVKFKGWGAELELEKRIQVAKAEVVIASQKVIEAVNSPAEEREKVIFEYALAQQAFSQLQEEAANLQRKKIHLSHQLGGIGLTMGRGRVLNQFISAIGVERIANMSAIELRDQWPSLLDEIRRSSNLINEGMLRMMQSLGVVDGEQKITLLGAEICVVIAKEDLLAASLATRPRP